VAVITSLGTGQGLVVDWKWFGTGVAHLPQGMLTAALVVGAYDEVSSARGVLDQMIQCTSAYDEAGPGSVGDFDAKVGDAEVSS
jgi:hypothetical protein